MIARLSVVVLVSLALLGCGVKTQLELPDQKKPEQGQRDPSLPPQPLGQ